MSEERTFRGASLAEVEAQVRAELGPDAVIVRQREGLTGGVGGFFQKRLFEVDARSGGLGGSFSAYDDPADAPGVGGDGFSGFSEPEVAAAFQRHLQAAQSGAPAEAQPSVEEAAQAFVADAFPRLGEPEPEVAAQPEPQPQARPAAPAPDAGALAAMFAPDVKKPEPDWSQVEWFAPAQPAPAPQPEVLPATPAPATPAQAAPLATNTVAPAAAPAAPGHRWPEEALPIHGALRAHGLSDELSAELLDETVTHLLPFSSPGRLQPLVAGALARRIPAQPLRGAGGRVVGFVGPGGAGKTRCVARLAHAYAIRSNLPVACVALRPEDNGAELQRLLGPYGVPVHAAVDGRDARERVSRLRGEALVLVDTPGVSPRAEAELRVLAAELRQLALDECHLAMPATIGHESARELIAGTRSLGVDAIALTHADETDRLGTVVESAIESGLPLSYLSRGTIVTGGMRPAVADEIAAALTA
jgi:flagellar biosynthesis GTPase FlhF